MFFLFQNGKIKHIKQGGGNVKRRAALILGIIASVIAFVSGNLFLLIMPIVSYVERHEIKHLVYTEDIPTVCADELRAIFGDNYTVGEREHIITEGEDCGCGFHADSCDYFSWEITYFDSQGNEYSQTLINTSDIYEQQAEWLRIQVEKYYVENLIHPAFDEGIIDKQRTFCHFSIGRNVLGFTYEQQQEWERISAIQEDYQSRLNSCREPIDLYNLDYSRVFSDYMSDMSIFLDLSDTIVDGDKETVEKKAKQTLENILSEVNAYTHDTLNLHCSLSYRENIDLYDGKQVWKYNYVGGQNNASDTDHDYQVFYHYEQQGIPTIPALEPKKDVWNGEKCIIEKNDDGQTELYTFILYNDLGGEIMRGTSAEEPKTVEEGDVVLVTYSTETEDNLTVICNTDTCRKSEPIPNMIYHNDKAVIFWTEWENRLGFCICELYNPGAVFFHPISYSDGLNSIEIVGISDTEHNDYVRLTYLTQEGERVVVDMPLKTYLRLETVEYPKLSKMVLTETQDDALCTIAAMHMALHFDRKESGFKPWDRSTQLNALTIAFFQHDDFPCLNGECFLDEDDIIIETVFSAEDIIGYWQNSIGTELICPYEEGSWGGGSIRDGKYIFYATDINVCASVSLAAQLKDGNILVDAVIGCYDDAVRLVFTVKPVEGYLGYQLVGTSTFYDIVYIAASDFFDAND